VRSFCSLSGRAKLSTTSRDGKTLIVRIAEAGELLGLHAVVTGKPYELTVEHAASQLNFVRREDMLRFLNEHPAACFRATQHLARDCSDSYGVVRTIGCRIRFRSDLPDSAGHRRRWRDQPRRVRVRLAMTHEEISQLVGTSRETITRLLSEFRRNELAELDGSMLIIHNHPALRNMVRA